MAPSKSSRVNPAMHGPLLRSNDHGREQHDSVAVDPGNGEILDRIDFADWPIMAKLASWGIDAHMGLLFGPVNQALLIALATGVICLISWGYRMWWHRRPTRADRRGQIASHPAGSRRPGRVAVLTIAAVGIGVALFFPVLGGSLLIFLAGDVIRTLLRRQTAPGPEPSRSDGPLA